MEEARGLFNCLQNCKVKHVKQNLNDAAYSLAAKEALSHGPIVRNKSLLTKFLIVF
jgi:hypothetical protein